MSIKVYGMENCGKCEAAKDKLTRMGLEYEEHSLEYHTTLHDTWRDDNTVDVRVAYEIHEESVPLIEIEGEIYTYSQAMKVLKEQRKGAEA